MNCYTCKSEMECVDDLVSKIVEVEWFECPKYGSKVEISYGNCGEYITNATWQR